MSDIITDAFQIRTDCDYNDYYIVSMAEVKEQVSNAEKFLSAIHEFLNEPD